MSNISGVVVTGVSGKMGQMLVKLIQSNEHLKLVGVTERKGHHWIGSDLGVLLGGSASEIIVSDSLLDLMPEAKVIISSHPKAKTDMFVKISDQAREAGVYDISLSTDK
jgi:4-hydroxy-tetrahydrodipicolinate reductase